MKFIGRLCDVGSKERARGKKLVVNFCSHVNHPIPVICPSDEAAFAHMRDIVACTHLHLDAENFALHVGDRALQLEGFARRLPIAWEYSCAQIKERKVSVACRRLLQVPNPTQLHSPRQREAEHRHIRCPCP